MSLTVVHELTVFCHCKLGDGSWCWLSTCVCLTCSLFECRQCWFIDVIVDLGRVGIVADEQQVTDVWVDWPLPQGQTEPRNKVTAPTNNTLSVTPRWILTWNWSFIILNVLLSIFNYNTGFSWTMSNHFKWMMETVCVTVVTDWGASWCAASRCGPTRHGQGMWPEESL